MNKRYFSTEQDGFYGVFYQGPVPSEKAFIVMLGESSDGRMVESAVKWLQKRGCSVMAMSPDRKDGYYDYPLERFGRAIEVLKKQGNEKIGFVGASITGMVALAAASYFPEITLTIAMTPPDFIMEGFYRGKKDGAKEWPSGGSSMSWQGQPLPYLPYAYCHPQYWNRAMAESKAGKNLIASRHIFDESERLHPIQEAEKIKVENIRGKIIFVGAEDDVLWDTCKYIRRMKKRLDERPNRCEAETLIYKHGTHFVFPQSMLKTMLPVGSGLLIRLMFRAGREHPKECRQTRMDIDQKLSQSILAW